MKDINEIKKELFKYFQIESEEKIESLLKSKDKKEVQRLVDSGGVLPIGIKVKYEMFRALSFFHHYTVTNQEFILGALMASVQKAKEYENAF